MPCAHRGHVILSHGLESGPNAAKVSALAEVAEARGFSTERPDYLDLDATREIDELHNRIGRLLDRCRASSGPLVLGGSSMGAFISALASLEVDCAGLVLVAPPVEIPGFARRLDADVPMEIIHGWRDELIPADKVIDFARQRRARLTLVDDSHRLEGHVAFCADAFGRFLDQLDTAA